MVFSVERFYPDYFTSARPQPAGVPNQLSYGGNYFDISLSTTDVGKIANLDNTKVVLIRTGCVHLRSTGTSDSMLTLWASVSRRMVCSTWYP